MDIAEILQRMWTDLIERPSGPQAFRFYLQPTMAILFAIRDGIKDAREHRSYYLKTILTNPAERKGLIVEGLKATSRILLIGFGIDVFYQLQVFDRFYPVEAIVICLLLAYVPYLVMRGPVARIARRRRERAAAGNSQ